MSDCRRKKKNTKCTLPRERSQWKKHWFQHGWERYEVIVAVGLEEDRNNGQNPGIYSTLTSFCMALQCIHQKPQNYKFLAWISLENLNYGNYLLCIYLWVFFTSNFLVMACIGSNHPIYTVIRLLYGHRLLSFLLMGP